MIVLIMASVLTACVTQASNTSFSTNSVAKPTSSSSSLNTALRQEDILQTWHSLQHFSTAKLTDMETKTNDSLQLAWIKLAILTKQKNSSSKHLADALLAWRKEFPYHPGNALIPDNKILDALKTSQIPQQIAVLLPQEGSYRLASNSIREGILRSYYANSPRGVKQKIKFYDTTQASSIIALYQQAIAEGADLIIGPLTKDKVQQLRETMHFDKPTLALNYSNNVNTTNFYEFGLLPEDEITQIVSRAREAGHVHAILIAPQTEWGKRLSSAFLSKWQKAGGQLQEAWYFSNRENFNQDIARLLKVNLVTDKRLMKKENNKKILSQQRRQDIDVIFLFAEANDAQLIVPLLRFYYAGEIPIFANSSIYSGKFNGTQNLDLKGVIICDIPWQIKLANQTHTEKPEAERLYAMGQDAYLLSQSLERLEYLPQFPLYGMTGAMTMSPQHQIHRRLPCAPINYEL